MALDIELVSIILIGGMFLLLALGVPIGFVTGGIACLLTVILFGPSSLEIVVNRVLGFMKGYLFIAAPMFVLMAAVLQRAGVIETLFQAIHVWFGPVRGGLAVTSVVAGTIIAAMSGIIGTGVVALTIIALPAMLKRGYDKQLACGSIMAGGDLGTLIPPSVVFVIYALVSGTSIGKLFIAGIMPGLFLSISYISYILIRCAFSPKLAPAASAEEREMPLSQKLALGKGLILPFFLIVIVLGSIYAGFATPTEAGAVGTIGAIITAIIHRKFKWKLMKEAIFQTAEVICMMAWIGFGALALVSVYAMAGGMNYVRELILGTGLSPIGIVFVMQLILIILGTLMSWMGILFLTIPIFAPMIVALGFDPIWFGVLFVMNMQIGYMSPPFGQSIFYVRGVAPPEVDMATIIKSTLPFMAIQLFCLIIVVFNPQVATWLPGKMMGQQ